VSAAEAVGVSQVVVTEGGTVTPSTAVTSVQVYLDGNNNGTLQGTDPQVGGTATFSGTTATVSVSPALILGAGSTTNFLIVYTLSGNGTAGQTIDGQWASSAALTLTGQISSASVTAAASPSFPVSGGAWTLTDGPPVLTVSAGTGHPAASTLPGNQSGVCVAVARLTASGEPQTVSAVSVAASGTANDTTAVAQLRLFRDHPTLGTQGALDGNDTQLGTGQTFATDDGTVTVSGLGLVVSQSASEDVLVVVDWNAPGIQTGQTFRATVTAVAATGNNSSLTSTVNGLPFAGNTHTLAVPGGLSLTAGPRMPPAQVVASGATAVPVWQVRLQAGATEDVEVTGLTVTPASALPAGFFGTLRLFWDANSNGVFDAGVDVLLATPGTLSGSPAQCNWTLAQRVSGGTYQDWLIVADVTGTLGQQNAVSVASGALAARGLASGLTESTGLALTGLPQTGGPVTVERG